jgi:uncharacterized protein (TIRG00374 family)
MSQKVRLLSVVFGAAGAGVFAGIIARTGVATIFENARLLGLGFVILIALAGARHVLRTLAWRRCLETQTRPPSFLHLFRLRLVCEAFDDLAPAGSLASESMKVWAGSKQMSFEASASSVIVENLMYGLAVCVFVLGGATLALAKFAHAQQLVHWVAIVCAGLAALVWFFPYIVQRESSFSGRLFDYLRNRRWWRGFLGRYGPKLFVVEETVRSFFSTRGKIFLEVLGIELTTNFIGVLDAYVILKATTGHGSMAAAYIIESVTRALQLGLAFIPGRLGVMEGAMGASFRALGYAASAGVSLVLFRRLRAAFWAGLGLLFAPRIVTDMYPEKGIAQ